MIRWPVHAAHFTIHPNLAHAGGDRSRDEEVVQAKPPVATKPAQPVIPPGVNTRVLRFHPHRIMKPPAQKGTKLFALRLAAQDLAAPSFGVVHVSIFGRDIEVTADENR